MQLSSGDKFGHYEVLTLLLNAAVISTQFVVLARPKHSVIWESIQLRAFRKDPFGGATNSLAVLATIQGLSDSPRLARQSLTPSSQFVTTVRSINTTPG